MDDFIKNGGEATINFKEKTARQGFTVFADLKEEISQNDMYMLELNYNNLRSVL